MQKSTMLKIATDHYTLFPLSFKNAKHKKILIQESSTKKTELKNRSLNKILKKNQMDR